jgi:hypothetical protein
MGRGFAVAEFAAVVPAVRWEPFRAATDLPLAVSFAVEGGFAARPEEVAADGGFAARPEEVAVDGGLATRPGEVVIDDLVVRLGEVAVDDRFAVRPAGFVVDAD